MQTDCRGDEVALLVELSEARAYESLLQAAAAPFLAAHGFRAVRIGSAVAAIAPSVTSTLNMNRVIGLGVAEEATAAMLETIIGLYDAEGIAFGIEMGPCARVPGFSDWLQKRRMRRSIATAMHYRVAAPLALGESPITVVRAENTQRELVADICCSVFRMPPTVHTLIAGTADRSGWRQWLAYLGDRPIAAALSFVHDGVAWLGWDATLPEFRGKGAHSALIVHRVNEAYSAGCGFVTTETAMTMGDGIDPSYRNYARLGFAFVYERPTYVSPRRTINQSVNA